MNRLRAAGLLLLLLLLLGGCAAPEAALPLAGLRAGLGPDCLATGAATHIGRGRFLTAAHLVDGTQPLLHGCAPGAAPPSIRFQGRDHAAELLRAGQADLGPGLDPLSLGTVYVGGRDVALLRVAGLRPGAAALPLCAGAPWPGQPVLVLTPRRHATSHIAGLRPEAKALHGAYAEMPLRLEPGESGGAVVDASVPCLLGLVSHRAEAGGRPAGTRLVPAPVLRAFLGE